MNYSSEIEIYLFYLFIFSLLNIIINIFKIIFVNYYQGTVIKKLGTTTLPWQVTATLVIGSKGHSDATLKGNTTATFTDGWANFSDLAITHAGLEYTIHFAVTSPPEAANFTMSISNITILGRQVTL